MHFKEVFPMFENIREEMKKRYAREIERIDPDVVEKDLTEFFEKTELNVYAGDRRKIAQALKESGLLIKDIKHEDHGAWNPIVTAVTYTINPFLPEDKTFKYVWR